MRKKVLLALSLESLGPSSKAGPGLTQGFHRGRSGHMILGQHLSSLTISLQVSISVRINRYISRMLRFIIRTKFNVLF